MNLPDMPTLPELAAMAPRAVDWGVVAVFGIVYLGMFLGGLPRLKLDRSGVALLGAIAMIAITGMPMEEAARSVDLPTVVLLFSFMVVSAQMRLGGFYTAVTQKVGELPLSRAGLLAALIGVAGALSAVFSNDIVCLAMTPVVARLCLKRGLDPLPFLIGLACAANIGSAATLIGNPQNMLIGSVLKLPFGAYVQAALAPVVASLLLLWVWLAFGPGTGAGAGTGAAGNLSKPAHRARADNTAAGAQPSPTGPDEATPLPPSELPPFDPLQTAKGLTVAAVLMGIFLFTDWPRDEAALVVPAYCCSAAASTRRT